MATSIPGYTFEPDLDLIGKGGMASVFLATQLALDRKVALKVLTPHSNQDSSFPERFTRETRILAQLSHPSIISIHEAGIHQGVPFLSMDYAAGGDLASKLNAGVSTLDALHICRQTASALAYLHSKGFIHRDIKPANILFRADGSVAVSDFGIAKHVDSTQITQFGAVIGTPAYLSPEQIRGTNLDGRSDLYSLGVVLYELLTGTRPFAGEPAEVVQQHLSYPVPELPEAKRNLDWVVARLLAKNPEERFQSAEELVSVLDDKIRSGDQETVRLPRPRHDALDRGRKKTLVGLPRFDANREARFQLEHVRYSMPIIRATIPLGILLYLGFFIWDYVQVGFDPLVTFSVRFAFALFGAGVFASTFSAWYQSRAQWLLGLSITIAALGVEYILYRLPDGFTLGYGGICLAMMYGCSLFALQFRTSVAFVLVTVVSTNLLILIAHHTYAVSYVLANTNFFVVSFAVFGSLFAYFMEHNLRTRFDQVGTLTASPLPWADSDKDEPISKLETKLFICYRRDDVADFVGRLSDRLESAFGHDAILKDVDIVPLGSDYRVFLGRTIKNCGTMIVVIGKDWHVKAGSAEALSDPVRAEIELALNLGLRVFPVLVQGAHMPSSEELPQSIRALAFINAAVIRSDPDFKQDVTRLINQIADLPASHRTAS